MCTHPLRDQIERALIAGVARVELADRYSISADSLDRHVHSDHVSRSLVRLEEKRHARDRRTILARVEQVVEEVEQVLQAAKATERHSIVLQATAPLGYARTPERVLVRPPLDRPGPLVGSVRATRASEQPANPAGRCARMNSVASRFVLVGGLSHERRPRRRS